MCFVWCSVNSYIIINLNNISQLVCVMEADFSLWRNNLIFTLIRSSSCLKILSLLKQLIRYDMHALLSVKFIFLEKREFKILIK
jgi:hypothetical protein